MTAEGTTIVCENVTYTYPSGVRALDGVDLVIEPGERVAIVGQNGSGKTTLVRHFNGLLRPEMGRVMVGAAETRTTPIAKLAARVGLAFQDPDRQIFGGSVESEVAFGARNVGLRGEALGSAVSEAIESVGLTADRKTNPYDLGYSRRKLLAIGSVLSMRTPILVLDEPTTGQDARGIATIQRIVDAVAAAGRTVIAISHDMRFVAESFDRIVVMSGGSIVFDGETAAAFDESNWPTLRETNLEPTYAALAGARLALGSAPTDPDVIARLRVLAGSPNLRRS